MAKQSTVALVGSLDELISFLEDLKQQKRDRVGNTRTKVESHEAKGEMLGIDEALYWIRAYRKGLFSSPSQTSEAENWAEEEYPPITTQESPKVKK